jgi:hypothetical protein
MNEKLSKQHFVVVPDNLRNRNRELYNHSHAQWWIYIFFTGIILLLISLSGSVGWLGKAILLSLALIIAIIFFKFFRDEMVVLRTKLLYDFVIRGRDGETIVAKYRHNDIQKIKKIVLVEEIYPRGLIRFQQKSYAVMYNYSPPNVGGDGLWPYILSTVHVIHSLMHPMLLKFYVMNKISDPITYKKDLVKSLNNEQSTSEQKEHVLSLIKLIEDKKDRSPDWVFRCLIGIGSFNTYEEAEREAKGIIPGFELMLQGIGIQYRRLENEYEICDTLRDGINPMN